MTAYEKPRLLDVEKPRCEVCGGEDAVMWRVTTPPSLYPTTHYVCPACAGKRIVMREQAEEVIAAWDREADA